MRRVAVLGAGLIGMGAYLSHLGPSQERRRAALGTPSLAPEIRDALIAGVGRETAGRGIAEPEAARDKALIAILHVRKEAPHV